MPRGHLEGMSFVGDRDGRHTEEELVVVNIYRIWERAGEGRVHCAGKLTLLGTVFPLGSFTKKMPSLTGSRIICCTFRPRGL